MKRDFFNALLVLIISFSLHGCAGQAVSSQTPDTPGDIKTVTDMLSREITLGGDITRIAAISPADCEIIYALGAGELLVGRGEYCDYPEEISSLPVVASGIETNIEQIIALNPQIVVMDVMAQSPEHVTALEAAGIKAAVTDAQNIEGTYEAIKLIGAITEREKEAEDLIYEMVSGFARIKTEAAEKKAAGGLNKNSVYIEVSPLEFGLWTAGEGTFLNEISQIIGLDNIFGDLKGWVQISEEQVISREPAVIITISMYSSEGEDPSAEISKRAGWADVPAVKNGDIFFIDSNEISRPGPRLLQAAELLYGLLYE